MKLKRHWRDDLTRQQDTDLPQISSQLTWLTRTLTLAGAGGLSSVGGGNRRLLLGGVGERTVTGCGGGCWEKHHCSWVGGGAGTVLQSPLSALPLLGSRASQFLLFGVWPLLSNVISGFPECGCLFPRPLWWWDETPSSRLSSLGHL